jgi:hypothetical protein
MPKGPLIRYDLRLSWDAFQALQEAAWTMSKVKPSKGLAKAYQAMRRVELKNLCRHCEGELRAGNDGLGKRCADYRRVMGYLPGEAKKSA